MTKEILNAGDTLDSRCTKCRKTQSHTLLTLEEDKPKRVECGHCGWEHDFKPPTAPKRSPGRPASTRKKTKKGKNDPAADRKEWEALRPSLSDKNALAYSMEARFRPKDLMDHPIFGLGLVQRMAGPNKVEVLFQEGRKLMRCQ